MPGDDAYRLLGVEASASDEELRSAYRAQVRLHHPDQNPGDPGAADRFRAVQAAYEAIQAARAERARRPPSDPNAEQARLRSLFDELVTAKRREFEARRPTRAPSATRAVGAEPRAILEVPFAAAIVGGEHILNVVDERGVSARKVRLPPGLLDGESVRVEGIVMRAEVAAHPHLTRRGDDVWLDVPVTLPELVFGRELEVPTASGRATLRVPPGAAAGAEIALAGAGVGGRGSQICRLVLALPDPNRAEVRQALAALEANPRAWSRRPR